MNKAVIAGKNCFVTGASGGIGREIAIQLAKNGGNVFLTARNVAKLKSLEKEIENIGNNVKVSYYIGDLNNVESIMESIETVRAKLGTIDILINAAGIFPHKSLGDSTIEDFDECFNVNVKAPFIFCREFSKDMVKNKWGRIVNISSSSAYEGFKGTSIYCASKHAVLGLSRSIYSELKEHKVRAFCVSPGSVKTEMGKQVENQDFNTFIEPKEVAEYVVFLISFDDNMISQEVRLNRMFIQ